MKRIGIPGEVVVPSGVLVGPDGDIPITSMACSFCVGAIPTCRIGIPIEFRSNIPNKATTDLYTVQVGQGDEMSTIFTGYIAGPSGRVSSTSVEAGLTLVHPARDLDTMRLTSPGMHTQGVADWSYERTVEDSEQGLDMFDANSEDPMPKQLIDGIIANMQHWNTVREDYSDSSVPEPSIVSYDAAIALLKKIKVLNGSLGEIGSTLADTIDSYAKASLNGSWNTQSSLWNTIISILSDFGLTVICDNLGNTSITADMANFQPPDDNYIYSDEIDSIDQASSFGRNVTQVLLLDPGIRPMKNEDGESTTVRTLAAWPVKAAKDGAGGTLAMAMPGWLTALTFNSTDDGAVADNGNSDDNEPPSASNPKPKAPAEASLDETIEKSRVKLAHKYYNLERDKWRTVCIPGPLAPGAVPGTTTWIQPYSAVVGMDGSDISGNALYSGYIAEVQHAMNAQGRILTTTLVLSHVSSSDEALNVTEDPVFTDVKPFVLK